MKILTSLAENDYFLGLSALINSVVKHGTYFDKVVVGYRGALPAWLPNLSTSKNGKSCTLKSGLVVEFILLESDLHMVHEKPKWFKYLTEVLEPDAMEYCFFDSDIIIINRMSFFGEWIRQGIALCEDVNYNMSANHPIRKQWEQMAEQNGMKVNKRLDRYYNSGFLGWSKNTVQFVYDWERCFQVLSKRSGDMKKFRVFDRTNAVLSANQDSLNVAAMVTEAPISTIGPEAMGFTYGFPLMVHPLGHKPWKRKFFNEFITGEPPRVGDVEFWQNVNGTELNPVSSSTVSVKVFTCKLLRGLARVYKRL